MLVLRWLSRSLPTSGMHDDSRRTHHCQFGKEHGPSMCLMEVCL